MASTPASASSPRPASPGTTSSSCRRTSSSRTRPAPAHRCRNPLVRLIAAMKAASHNAAIPYQRSHSRPAQRISQQGCFAGRPEEGLGRRAGDLAPLATSPPPSRRRRRGLHGGTLRQHRRSARSRPHLPVTLGPRRAWRFSTAPRVSAALALAALLRVRRLFKTARTRHRGHERRRRQGSDAPFDARIHAIRGHRGQIAVAAAFRAFLHRRSAPATKSVRRVRTRTRSALPAAGHGCGARQLALAGTLVSSGQRRERQPADLRRR
ncbi:MAG: aromatic amino acid lyase [Geminicoccaceae bacterium]